MRTAARTALALATLTAFGAVPAQAQAHLSVGIGAGPLFAGVVLGIGGGHYNPTSIFVGSAFGLGHHGAYGGAYGIYSNTYDGWGLGYRGGGMRLSATCRPKVSRLGLYPPPACYVKNMRAAVLRNSQSRSVAASKSRPVRTRSIEFAYECARVT